MPPRNAGRPPRRERRGQFGMYLYMQQVLRMPSQKGPRIAQVAFRKGALAWGSYQHLPEGARLWKCNAKLHLRLRVFLRGFGRSTRPGSNKRFPSGSGRPPWPGSMAPGYGRRLWSLIVLVRRPRPSSSTRSPLSPRSIDYEDEGRGRSGKMRVTITGGHTPGRETS